MIYCENNMLKLTGVLNDMSNHMHNTVNMIERTLLFLICEQLHVSYGHPLNNIGFSYN